MNTLPFSPLTEHELFSRSTEAARTVALCVRMGDHDNPASRPTFDHFAAEHRALYDAWCLRAYGRVVA